MAKEHKEEEPCKKEKVKTRPYGPQREESERNSERTSEAASTSSAHPPLLRRLSLATIERPQSELRHRALVRSLSSTDLRRVSDLKLTQASIIGTLEKLKAAGHIEFEHKKSKIKATKIGDHTFSITIHLHGAWHEKPEVIADFLAFVHASDPDFSTR